MSDLQISLLAIGACVVAGVYLFNWWQERQFHRRTELAFERKQDDVLMPAAQPADDEQTAQPADQGPAARIEPTLEEPPLAAPISRQTRPAAAIMLDPVIDYVVEVELDAPHASAGLHQELNALAANWGKPVLVAGYDAAAGEWHPAGIDNGKQYSQLRFAVQMSNRAGCIEQNQLTAFRAAVQNWAQRNAGTAKCLETELAHAMAVQLDRFCADVDIAIGINVITRDGNPFSGTKIRALAEAGGLKLESDGVFYLRGDTGETLFTLDNHEPMPFVPEQMKALSTAGVTFLLDVPRVANALREFDVMLVTARNFAATLGGTLVDDNRAALSDDAIDKIRRQLTGILAKMEAGQIAAGGARALRLFS
jgi:FtsZ-interacting cell division protein ZipA